MLIAITALTTTATRMRRTVAISTGELQELPRGLRPIRANVTAGLCDLGDNRPHGCCVDYDGSLPTADGMAYNRKIRFPVAPRPT